jgi:GNAT superfamily N-acetyltransferase
MIYGVYMKIRSYENKDRKDLEEICISTGLNGELKQYFEDEDLFTKLWLSAYLDGQPENAFVVDYDGKIIGYLVSCFGNYKKYLIRFTLRWYCLLLWRYLTGHYKNTKFVKWCLFKSWRESPKIPKNSAHFHFNLMEGYRNKRLGIELIKKFEQKCKEKNINLWYGITFIAPNRRQLKSYIKMGMKLYSKKRCTLFENSYTVCLTKEIL